MTLALLDVDGFESLNDGHGHPAGGACLKHVAAVLEGNVREGDWLGRWGGDEFVVVLWGVRGDSRRGKRSSASAGRCASTRRACRAAAGCASP